MSNGEAAAWLRRNRNNIVAAAATLGAGYAVYRAYYSTTLSDTQQALKRATATVKRYSDAAASAGEAVAVLAADLRSFLASDSDEVPQSVKQLAKLARSDDVQASLRACVASAIAGVSQPLPAADGGPVPASILDKIIEATLSDRGHSLISLAISVAVRNSTAAVGEQVRVGIAEFALRAAALRPQPAAAAGQPAGEAAAGALGGGAPPSGADMTTQALTSLLGALSTPQGERLLRLVISSSITTLVRTYLEGASSYDMYTPMLAAVAQPQHTRALSELMSNVAGAATQQLVASWFAATSACQQQPQPQACPEQHAAAAAVRRYHSGPLVEEPTDGCSSHAGPMAECPSSEPCSPQSSSPHSGPHTPEPSIGQPESPGRWASGWGGLLRRRHGRQQQHAEAAQAAGASFAALALSSGRQPLPLPLAVPGTSAGGWSDIITVVGRAAGNDSIRRLMVDVSASSTREAVKVVMQTLWDASAAVVAQPGSMGVQPGGMGVQALMYRMWVMLSVVIFVFVYAVSPQVALQAS